MKLFNKVAIIGVGLVGGCIALEVKRKKLASRILGVSRRKRTIQIARKLKIIDEGSQKFDIIKDVDLLVLAMPVSTILDSAKKISRFIKPDCIVTDVGSTKEEIVTKLEKIFPNYVGSHPLAGSEKRGVSNAHPGIFNDSLCILTPTKNTDPQLLEKIQKFWVKIGTKVIILSASKHDKIISTVSHLPHLVAFSLIKSIPSQYLKLSASGLKDTTRIALSDSSLWADIFLSNRKNVIKAIKAFQGDLLKAKSAIARKDRASLIRILSDAKKKRELL